MEKLTCYVICASEKIERLSHFLRCASDSHVVPIPAVTKEQVSLLGNSSALFNLKKAEELLERTPNNKEIAHTLSHIQCWKAIAENKQLQDNDFALIAESEIQPVENFIKHAIHYANKYSSYGIIKLQHDGEGRSGERLFQIGDEPYALIYGDINQYNYGCSLYLIRKNVAKKLTVLLSETKPYWLADQFTAFHEPQNIAQACYLLGENPTSNRQDKIENPLFSIIVPIYNVERYLEQCIESVLAQDYQNYELILVDDGSPDNSIDICTKYAKQHHNIVFIRKVNGGISDARNAGIKLARGEYLIFLDSDDYWNNIFTLSDLARLAKKEVDLILCGCHFLFPDNTNYVFKLSKENLSFSYLKDFFTLVKNNYFKPSPWSKIIKRKIILENRLFFPTGKTHEDLGWSFDIAKHIQTYDIYETPFYIYRTKRKGATTEFVKFNNTKDLIEIAIEKLANLDEECDIYDGLLQYIKNQEKYITDSFNLLPETEKRHLNDIFNNFENLIKRVK